MEHTHVTAPTRFVEASGIRFAYHRFGREIGLPLVFMPHFRAGMDHWDPAVTDGFAANLPVVLFDNAGVAGSSGETIDGTMMRMIPDINLAAGDINSPGTDGRPNAGQPHFHSSTLSPGTDAKCRTLLVTTVASTATACEAIMRSRLPIGLPARSSAARMRA